MDFIVANWRLAAVATLFFLGVVLRRAGLSGEAQGRGLLNLVLNVGLPALIFGSLAAVPMTREHAVLPLIALLTMLCGWTAAVFVARRFQLARPGEGALVLCAMSLNIAMIYPFAALSLGNSAFAELVMFDMGHAVMVWTLSAVLACRYGGHTGDIPVLLKRSLTAPPLWALVLALGINFSALPVPRRLIETSLFAGQGLVLLVPLAMGLLVSARALRRPPVFAAVALRSGLGALVGMTLAWLFGLSGTAAQIAVLGAAAPVGFTAVVLSAREQLDLDLAASAAAISVFLGSIWLPLAMVVLDRA